MMRTRLLPSSTTTSAPSAKVPGQKALSGAAKLTRPAPPAARPGRIQAAKLKKERAAHRAQTHAAAAADDRSGLTFLHRFKTRPATRAGYDANVRGFLEWAQAGSLESIPGPKLDRILAEFLDALYWRGEKSEVGSRLLASIHHYLPALPRARFGGLPEARAALSGFQSFSRGQPMPVLAKPYMLGILGISVLEGDLEFAAAVYLAWDAMLRLPSDLVALKMDSLIGPGRSGAARWALLLYREEHATRSKTSGVDEGVMLRSPTWTGGGRKFLLEMRGSRSKTQNMWRFTAAEFTETFRRRLALLPSAPNAIPYQMRHGSASHAAAIEGWTQAQLMERLRHKAPSSTVRYSRHVRYLAELEKVPRSLDKWAEEVEGMLDDILGHGSVPRMPAFLSKAELQSGTLSRPSAERVTGVAASSSSRSATASGRSRKRSTPATSSARSGSTERSRRRRRSAAA